MYAVFETDIINIKRYYFDFFRNNDKVRLILLYQRSQLTHNYRINTSYVSFLSRHKIKTILLDNNIKIMFINGQRIPDLRLTSICKSIGIKVFYLQHGNHRLFLKRNFLFYLKKFTKTFSYFFDSLSISLYFKNPSLCFNLLMIHCFGKARSSVSNKSLLPDKCFYFSNYSKNWHFNHYFNKNQIPYNIIGTPDIKKFNFTSINDNNTITYCYQTLVEDGLLNRSQFTTFYDEMISWIEKNSFSLIIKLHPRTSKNLLQVLKRKNVEFIYDELPNTNYIIGHYSGLLPVWALKRKQVISYVFPSIIYPDFISSWTYNIDTFRNFKLEDVNCKFEELSYYYNDFFKPINL